MIKIKFWERLHMIPVFILTKILSRKSKNIDGLDGWWEKLTFIWISRSILAGKDWESYYNELPKRVLKVKDGNFLGLFLIISLVYVWYHFFGIVSWFIHSISLQYSSLWMMTDSVSFLLQEEDVDIIMHHLLGLIYSFCSR